MDFEISSALFRYSSNEKAPGPSSGSSLLFGNQILYSLNKKSPVYDEIKGIIIKTIGIKDEFENVLLSLKNRISLAFIYGSFASMDFTLKSDIDLLVCGNLKLIDVVRTTSEVGRKLSRVINPVVISEKEFRRQEKISGSFISRIISGPKLKLFAESNES